MTTFDPAKDQTNLAKHGVTVSAAEGFDWSTALIEEDRSQTYGEQRERAIGFIDARLYVYVHTMRGDEDRAVSLRVAEKKDRTRYEKHICETFGL